MRIYTSSVVNVLTVISEISKSTQDLQIDAHSWFKQVLDIFIFFHMLVNTLNTALFSENAKEIAN